MLPQLSIKRNLSDAMMDNLSTSVTLKQYQGVIDADRAFVLRERLIEATPPFGDEQDKINALAKLHGIIECSCCDGTGIMRRPVGYDAGERFIVTDDPEIVPCKCCGG